MIFVFGSNRAGVHGVGAAKYALEHRGAIWGIGEGHVGDSYALPTCDAPGVPLRLAQVRFHVDRFLDYAKKHPELQFQVTRVGCGFAGFAGFTEQQIAPLLVTAPDNCWLPSSFCRALSERRAHIPAAPTGVDNA